MELFAAQSSKRFAAKVINNPLHHFGYGEIAAADEDHISEMGVVDRRTVGVADGFIDLSAKSHVKGFFGQDIGVQSSGDVGFAEIILSVMG